MKKEVMTKNGKKQYLLGRDEIGKVWLEEASWDCGWYWGLGYVKMFGKHECHTHFDYQFFKSNKNGFDRFKEIIKETSLSDKELWVLLELMKSAYTARAYSDMLYLGGAHYTQNPCASTIQCEAEYNRINEDVIPAIMKKVYELLTPEEEGEKDE